MREAANAPRVATLVVGDAAARDAVKAAQALFVTARVPAPAVQAITFRNVAGVLRGTDRALRSTYVVLSAHYDHLGARPSGDGDRIFNGANDNASGVATVIESAHALAVLGARPKRSVVFLALFGEEAGGLGSRYYCQHPLVPLAATVADVNLEQIGRTDDVEGPHVRQFNLTGFDYTTLAVVFGKAGADTGVKVVKHEKFSDPYFNASDNAAFAEIGVPSTTISVTYQFPDYHKVGDEWEKLDYDNMTVVVDAIALGVYRLATDARAPEWNKANPKVARYVQARQKK
jgi:Zn-dependent M28 family amino/carboxypeptidase